MCGGFQRDNLGGNWAAWTVGSTITYTAGFKVSPQNKAQVFNGGVSTTTDEFTYVVLDAAVALAAGAAAVSAVNSMLF